MIVLAVDTGQEACSAAVVDGDRVLAARVEPMARGHQERLASLVREVMAEAGVGFSALDRIGVAVGPGSFTGLRVGLAFAKGLGLALDRPVVGVGSLAALAASGPVQGLVAVAVDARRGQIYLQAFVDGAAATEPLALTVEDAAARLAALDPAGPARLTGPGAALLAEVFPDAVVEARACADPVAVARLAAEAAEPAAPEPVYLRAPDARLPERPRSVFERAPA